MSKRLHIEIPIGLSDEEVLAEYAKRTKVEKSDKEKIEDEKAANDFKKDVIQPIVEVYTNKIDMIMKDMEKSYADLAKKTGRQLTEFSVECQYHLKKKIEALPLSVATIVFKNINIGLFKFNEYDVHEMIINYCKHHVSEGSIKTQGILENAVKRNIEKGMLFFIDDYFLNFTNIFYR